MIQTTTNTYTLLVINLSRAFCDPRPRSNQIMSAAQNSAFNTIRIRARNMEIDVNYKMASSDSEITFLKNNLSNFERRGNLIIVIHSHTVVHFKYLMFSLVLAI